ncbi:MAG: crossover junction endodeoxyribonuclease RuvC [Candidatus Omnitrophota bacterium]|jgi:crossover junction endodeoxyribonuclease RuvC|nr:MAG: crossover junction endodeoxyribonuclease RuvC [Candidatus Omnitrophota bacterium]
MIILGIDPALTITGYGIINFSDTQLRLLKAGALITTPKESLPQRLERIHEGVLRLIKEHAPDAMVLEKLYAHYRHPTTAYLLGEARGVVCLACAKSKLPLIEYAATRVKKSVVGRGHASKFQVARMVVAMLGLRTLPRYTDVTDALALAIAYAHTLRSRV